MRRFATPAGDVTVISGCARGADSLATGWAQSLELPVETYPADWDKYGKSAGPIRNQQMLMEGKPELVIAFIDKPRAESKGTNDMVHRAKKAGIPTHVVEKVA